MKQEVMRDSGRQMRGKQPSWGGATLLVAACAFLLLFAAPAFPQAPPPSQEPLPPGFYPGEETVQGPMDAGETDYVLTVAGGGGVGDEGPAVQAGLNIPWGVAFDAAGNVYIADAYNHRIRVVNRQTVNITVCAVTVGPGNIDTIAGTGQAGNNGVGLPGVATLLNSPRDVAVDPAGDVIIADRSNHRVLRVDVASGIVSVVAGTGVLGYAGDGGPAAAAQIAYPYAVASDSSGNVLISDAFNQRLRMVNTQALPINPAGVTIAPGNIDTIAGDGVSGFVDNEPSSSSRVVWISGIAVEPTTGGIVLADFWNDRVRVVNPDTSSAITLAGVSIPPAFIRTVATIGGASGVAVDGAGNLYVSDTLLATTNKVYKVDPSGAVTDFAGSGVAGYGGDGNLATDPSVMLGKPLGLAALPWGDVVFAEMFNNRVRIVYGLTGIIDLVAGSGYAGFSGDDALSYTASLGIPRGVRVNGIASFLVAEQSNYRVFVVDAQGNLDTVAGTGTGGFNGDGPAGSALLNRPDSAAWDASGNVYVADTWNHRIRVVNREAAAIVRCGVVIGVGQIGTIAGTGVAGFSGDGGDAPLARLYYPSGIDVTQVSGEWVVLVADTRSHRIRAINTSSSVTVSLGGQTIPPRAIVTVAGSGGIGGAGIYSGDGVPATTARFQRPHSVRVGPGGDIYVADYGAHCVRRIDAAGDVWLVAGTPVEGANNWYLGGYADGPATTVARFYYPADAAPTPGGDVYVADESNHRIRKFTAATASVDTFAGNGTGAFAGDGGPALAAGFMWPSGVDVDLDPDNGFLRVWVADYGNNRIRRITPENVIATPLPYTVSPIPGITFTFNNGVTTGGFLGVTTSQELPVPLPPGLKTGAGANQVYYTVDPNGIAFPGTVTVTINYDNQFPPPGEQSLKLMQWNGVSWSNITDGRDPISKRIWGTTNQLSLFAVLLPVEIGATLEIDPDVINRVGKGRWVTAYLEFPAPFDSDPVGSVDLTQPILLNQAIQAVGDATYGFFADPQPVDSDADGVPELMVKFPRDQVATLLDPGENMLTVQGTMADGSSFVATAVVRAR